MQSVTVGKLYYNKVILWNKDVYMVHQHSINLNVVFIVYYTMNTTLKYFTIWTKQQSNMKVIKSVVRCIVNTVTATYL